MNEGAAARLEIDPDDRRALPYRHAAGTQLTTGAAGEQGTQYFLRAPDGQPLVLAEEERFLWEALDANSSFAQIARRFRARFDLALAPEAFANFVGTLIEAGTLERRSSDEQQVRVVQFGAAPQVRKIELASDSGASAQSRQAARSGRSPRKRIGFRHFKNPLNYSFDHSGRVLSALTAAFWPIRYVSWLLVPLLLVGFLITIKHSDEYAKDWFVALHTLYLWPCFWLAEHVTTWSARVAEGVVIYGLGGIVTRIHVRLFLMFIRVKFEEELVESLPRRSQLWIAASPLLWRLFCFGLFQIIWIEARPNYPVIAQLAMFEGLMGLLSFFVSAMPFLPLYGYKLIVILLHQKNLYARAFGLLSMKLRGVPAPYMMTTSERWGLLVMAVGTALISTLYVANIVYQADHSIVTMFGGFGGWALIAILASTGTYFGALYRFSAKLRALQRAERVRDGGSGGGGSPDELPGPPEL